VTQATLNREGFIAFLTHFGDGVNDLRLDIGDNKVHGAVDVATHYCSRDMAVVIDSGVRYDAGPVFVPDLSKLVTFLKSSKETTILLRHTNNVLSVSAGSDHYSVPTHSQPLSALTINRAEEAIRAAKQSNWSRLGRAKLDVEGTLEMGNLHGLGTMTKVTGKDSPVRIEVLLGEMTVTAGNHRGARMARTISIDGGENGEHSTTFGSSLPSLLTCMPKGPVSFYMGDQSALVFSHNELSNLLILKHQEGVE